MYRTRLLLFVTVFTVGGMYHTYKIGPFPPGFLSNQDDMEAIVHGMGPLRLASRSAASSALGSSLNTCTAISAPPQARGSEERRRAGGRAAGENPDTAGRGIGGRGQGVPRGGGRGRAGRGCIPPPIETRAVPSLSDEAELVSAARWS